MGCKVLDMAEGVVEEGVVGWVGFGVGWRMEMYEPSKLNHALNVIVW